MDLTAFHQFMQWLANLLGPIYDFFVVGVLGYLAKKWLADKLVKKWHEWKTQTPRNLAIWEHYSTGHAHDDVLDCDQERCQVFKTYAS